MKNLSHYDRKGRASMVDVSAKAQTRRTATAQAFVKIKPSVLKKLPQNPKGDPLEVARFDGVARGDHDLVGGHAPGKRPALGITDADGLELGELLGGRHRASAVGGLPRFGLLRVHHARSEGARAKGESEGQDSQFPHEGLRERTWRGRT